jgi:hypothetical protein
VRRQGELALAVDTQAFALDPVQALGKQIQVGGLAEQCQTAGEEVAQFCVPSRQSALYGGEINGLQGQLKTTGVVAWFTRCWTD